MTWLETIFGYVTKSGVKVKENASAQEIADSISAHMSQNTGEGDKDDDEEEGETEGANSENAAGTENKNSGTAEGAAAEGTESANTTSTDAIIKGLSASIAKLQGDFKLQAAELVATKKLVAASASKIEAIGGALALSINNIANKKIETGENANINLSTGKTGESENKETKAVVVDFDAMLNSMSSQNNFSN